jgi:Predicted ABC-type transport system involved in lysophospholipase L1 biosynthesis, permease component
MKLFMIAKSNILKNKSMSLTLTALIILASILLYVGASVVLDLNTFLDDKNKELNGADFAVAAPLKYEETLGNIIDKMGKYKQKETVDAVTFYTEFKNLTIGEKSQAIGCVFLNGDSNEKISKLKIIGQSNQKYANSIVLPYYLKAAKGYKTGEEISIKLEGKEYKFVIYGFSEDIMFATPTNMSYYKCYLFGDEFDSIFKDHAESQFCLMKMKLERGTDLALYNDNFVKNMNSVIESSTSNVMVMDFSTMKVGVSIFLVIIMSVLIAFSAIIILITLTVIWFSIVTYMEGNMKNIGSMEALGYTGRELIFSTVFQFALITAVSIAIGLVLAVSCTGIVTNLASSSIGLVWNSKVNPLAVGMDAVVILLLVIGIAYLASAKLKRITPVTALREGIQTHNFKKNHFPLSKVSINVNAAIGLKAFMQNMKQNITIFIIVTLMSFVCVFAFSANYNFNINNRALLTIIGSEKSDLMVTYRGEDALQVFKEIGKMSHVKKIVRLSNMNMTVCKGSREMTSVVNVCNDYNKLEIRTIVNGRYPVHDNEIAVTGRVMEQLGAKLGDVIFIKNNNNRQEYMIVGVMQQIMHLGKGVNITEEGMSKIIPGFMQTDSYVYVDDAKNISSVKKEIEKQYKGTVVSNLADFFDTMLESFNKVMVILCLFCIGITLGIIALILYLLIRIKLIKERIRMGVNKAIGYTTGQIIAQIITGFCPICILGAFAGTVLATFLINPTFSALLSASGIRNCHLAVDPLMTFVTFLAITLFSVFTTALVALSVKKITPRELFL